jgi:hypothetical protein
MLHVATRIGRGNRRTGHSRGTPGRHGQLPWRDDPWIRQRIELVWELGYQRRSVLLDAINKWLADRDEECDERWASHRAAP